jgi:hypothetical protein
LKIVDDRTTDSVINVCTLFEIAKTFLKLVFSGDRHEAKCPCNRCWNINMLCEYKIYDHITKQGFITNYLVWHQDGEVKAPATDESNENDDKD